MTFNERIRLIRKDLNITQETFNNSIGVTRDVVNNLERGEIRIIMKLCCVSSIGHIELVISFLLKELVIHLHIFLGL